ncbi:hypothetical protein DJ030_01765 [bacterium endosymbiont of Escarpia laminata]|nr:MAG: hypothetical protein DJ030_01765 [bacterium endosymbiont of Escarpia laminata]
MSYSWVPAGKGGNPTGRQKKGNDWCTSPTPSESPARISITYLIPASGFFEWKAEKDGKQPYCFRPSKAPLFSFAGLYEHWDNQAGKSIDSCTILIDKTNEVVNPVHDRIPIVLHTENYEAWLDPDTHAPEILKPLLRPWSGDETDLNPVSKKVSKP